ncbi:MAG: 5'/3'-nucleotidase SurE [Chloroflexaceae bacterium]|nr:5'/3'-nucleotidase SurE [Chloroflexaceae bacterium]
MKLLICNDDGIYALGIRALANRLTEAGHGVTVVCPDRERSATGHGLTLHQPIRAEPISDIFADTIVAWACSGTPADCVKFALSAVLDSYPAFVLSGINHGPNLGTDVLYSGTVSAAMEGTIYGIPSLAISLASHTSNQFQVAADFACEFIATLSEQSLKQPTLYNINVPAVPRDRIAGARIARQGLRRYLETFEKRLDPRGKSYYWLAGEVVEEIEQPEHLHLPSRIPTDVQAIRDNFITITPLQYNFTDVQTLMHLDRCGGFDCLAF